MGKGKVLKTTISLLGKVDPSLGRSLAKAQKQSSKTGKSMSNNMKTAGAAMGKTIKGFAKTAVAVFATIRAASKLKEYAQECVTAAKAQIDAETKLETVLKNVEAIQIRGPNAAAEAAQNLKNTASDLQKTGVLGDEVLLSGMQQLATFQLDDRAISTLSTGMADLLAQQKGLGATQNDAVSVANMIGKVMTGSTGALTKMGITFTDAQEEILKTGDAEQRAATLAQVLQQNVGGVNEALAQTDQGKIQQAENTIGDLKEQIGMKLLPVIANVMSKVTPIIGKAVDGIGAALDKVIPYVEVAFDKIFAIVDKAGPYINGAFSMISETANQLTPIFDQIGKQMFSGIGNFIPSIMSLLQTMVGFIQQILPPIMTVIGIIAQAFAPIVSSLMSVAQMLLPKIGTLVQSLGPLFQALSPVLSFIGNLIGSVFGVIGTIIGGVIGIVTSLIEKLTGVITWLQSNFVNTWTSIWSGIGSFFSGIWTGIKNTVRTVLQGLVSPINGIIKGINKISSVAGIKAIPTIEIPQFAEGDTVTRPTLAVVGEGDDPETIVPHNNKPRSRMLLAQAAAGVGAKVGGGSTYTYAPVIYAGSAQGVKEVLDEDFERFRENMERFRDDEDRERF